MAGNHYALGQPMMPVSGTGRPVGGVPSLDDVRRVLSRSDKARPSSSVDTEGLLVNACGRTVNVPEGTGVTLLLHHVQKALQDELGLPNQTFDIFDSAGTRLLTDQDLREAVMGGKIPLNGKLTDTSAKIQSIQSDIKWVCQQVGILRGQLESQSKEHSVEIESLRNELYSVIETSKERTKVDPGLKGDGLKLDLINADSGIQLASMEQISNLETDIGHLGAKYEELSTYFRNVMSEYSRHHDRSSTQTSDAITRLVDRCAGLDARLTNAELGVRGGMAGKPRDVQSPHASSFPRSTGLGSKNSSVERTQLIPAPRMGPAASQSPHRAALSGIGGGNTPSNRSTRSVSPRFPDQAHSPAPSAAGSAVGSRALSTAGSGIAPPSREGLAPSIAESPDAIFRQRSNPPAPPGPLQLSATKNPSSSPMSSSPQSPMGRGGQGTPPGQSLSQSQGSSHSQLPGAPGTQVGKVVGSLTAPIRDPRHSA